MNQTEGIFGLISSLISGGRMGAFMGKEEEFLKKRIKDLAERSYRSGIYTYTGFLTQAQQDVYYQVKQELGEITGTFFGGVEGCERQVLRFGNPESLGYDPGFPICCIQISPTLAKFSDKLTHRDYLGALMHLGITRETLGDILMRPGKQGESGKREDTAYVFCLDKVADYIVENLDQIKHTSVRCQKLEDMPEMLKPEKELVNLVVPSMRLDVIVAKMCHLSRNQSLELFREKKIFVNGRQMENHSGLLKEEDTVSVRGYGKFICDGISGETRKGNLNIRIWKYV